MKQQHLQIAASALAALALNPALRAETVVGKPDAYLDYIEATGTQYIDTGVNAETGLKARMDFVPGAKVATNDDWAFLDAVDGTGSSDTRSRIMLCHLYNQKPFFGYGLKSRGNPANSVEIVRGQRYEIVTDISDSASLEVYQNGRKTFGSREPTTASHEEYSSIGTVNLNLNLYLFAGNNSGTANWKARGKLYECKIFKKNDATGKFDLLRHFLPAKKGTHVGLYDKANGDFYYDSEHEFLPGNELDRPLALVESLTSDGANDTYQCFNTWVWGKSGLKSEVDFSPLYPSGDRGILACRETSGDTRFFMAYHYETAFRFSTGKLPAKTDLNVVAPQKGVRYVIKTDTTPGAQSMTVGARGGEAVEVLKDGVDYGSSYMATTNTLALLATHRAYDNNFSTPAEGTLYATKIWDGDELLRDFVPCVATNAAGVLYAGLYDKVTERIYKPLKGKISSERDCPFDLESEVGAITNVLAEAEPPKTRLEYAFSDGKADFVDVGVPAKDGLEMDAVMEWQAAPDDDVFVGARLATSGDNANTRFFLYNAWPAHSIGYAKDLPRVSSGESSYHVPAVGTKYKISSRLDDGDQFLSVSEDVAGSWSLLGWTGRTYAGPLDLGIPLYLFARNLDGKPDSFSNARLYSLKLRAKQQDGSYAPVRDFVPVRDPLTGGAALWDRVSETYFRNGGQFLLAGGDVERPMESPFVLVVR